ncbi:hypothetical protein ACFLSJ_03935, partial [Verrucomicrobiota bacterium]
MKDATPSNLLVTRIARLFNDQLALENDYLRAENTIMRAKLGKRVPLTDHDRRRLVRYGIRIKDRLAAVASIVRPETLLAWNRRMKREKWTYDNRPRKPGRRPKSRETEELLVRLAEENGTWGYKRIAGELKKLGHVVCPIYVRNILKKRGIPPSPQRKGMSWKEFIESH